MTDIEWCREEGDETICLVDGERKPVEELTKEECTSLDAKRENLEYVESVVRVGSWNGVTDPMKQAFAKEKMEEGKNLIASVQQADNPPFNETTARKIQESATKVSSYCRMGRDRSATQPSSYEMDDRESTEQIEVEDQWAEDVGFMG